MAKIYIVSKRFGTTLEEPKVYRTRDEAKLAITHDIYDNLVEQLGEDLEEAGVDTKNINDVIDWAVENDYCCSYNCEDINDTVTVGDDWLECMITEAEIDAA